MHPLMKQLLEEHKALVSLVTDGLDFAKSIHVIPLALTLKSSFY